MIEFVGVVNVIRTFAYPNGLKFPLGQRGSDNRGRTVYGILFHHRFLHACTDSTINERPNATGENLGHMQKQVAF
jgi:hypothetical protein